LALANRSLGSEEVAALYARYGFFLLRRCRTILRDGALADDALQEAFVKIMRGGASIREADEPLRWLYRVVDRCCFDVLRKRRRSVETPSEDEGPSALHPALAIELRDVVVRMLATFDETEMRIAVLLFVDGLSQGEIAQEIGLSRVTVNKKVRAIRAGAEAWLGKGAPMEGTK
jgi:RNA polymerase sigma factor (sigma-70 family)